MNYYEILGVGHEATEKEIKEAYRREAMKWHPDRHEGAAAKAEADRRFKDLAVAYRTLRDVAARASYDRQLAQQLRREYEARQQEEARQQAERGQANKQQARPEQSGFADTRPPFEEDTASSDDANQMFYEQMLDLALELAGRGFPEFNIFKALVALGCPETLAKSVASSASIGGFQQNNANSSNTSPRDGLNSSHRQTTTSNSTSHGAHHEFVIKPKRRMAILMALFGLGLVIWSVQAWSVPIGAPSWSGKGPFGIPEYVIQYFIRFLGGPLGVLALIVGGQWCISNTLMTINNQGIRFSRGGGQLTKWSEIDSVTFEEKKLKIGVIKNGKTRIEELPDWLIDGDCQEIIQIISRFKVLSNSEAKHEYTEDVKNTFSKKEAQPNRQSKTTHHRAPISTDWATLEPYFETALVGPTFKSSIAEEFGVVKVVRWVLFIVFSLLFFALFTQGSITDADTLASSISISALLGWGVMFGILELSPTHRNYVLTERKKRYLPKFKAIFNSTNQWNDMSSAVLFPAPWLGYYGIIWPLVTVASIFFTIDFLLLINVSENIHQKDLLINAWEFSQKPWFFIGTWFLLGYSFNFLLFTRIKSEIFKIESYLAPDAAQKLFARCRPRLWRAFVATLLFILVAIAPGEFIFPDKKELLDTVLLVKKITPAQMLERAKPRFTDENYQGALTTSAALQMLRISADKGNIPAESFLGYIYGWGRGVTKSEKVASYWIERAANHGDSWSTDMLGNMKYRGIGGYSKNEVEAVAHWRTAAELGSPSAQTSLGWSYMIGIGGVPIDFQKAAFWNEKGADGGNAEGFNNLGWLYENGQGVPRNIAHAATLYRRASELGSEQAKERLLALSVQ